MTETATVIVGTKYKGAEAVGAVEKMRPGDAITLRRDGYNRHDANAVECWFLGMMVGFVPKITNPAIARAFDAGHRPTASVTAAARIERGKVRVEPKITVRWGE